ncbi:MAG: tetratricopeptide repeat protein [bacterium]
MNNIWQFLSGEVPGGFALPLVALIVFFPILEYIYRTGETMSRRLYLRWRWIGPVLILIIYALIWIQSPPKTNPVRVALITTEQSSAADWRYTGLQDLIVRRLANSLPDAMVNPWRGNSGEYDEPAREMLDRAGYKLYQLQFGLSETSQSFRVSAIRDDREIAAWDGDGRQLINASELLCEAILADLGKSQKPKQAFSHDVTLGTLQHFYTGITVLDGQRPNAARQYFEKALIADSTFLQAKIWRGISLEKAGEKSEAALQFIAAMQDRSADTEIMLMAGEFFLRIKEWDKAEPPLKLALTRNPACIRASYGLCQLHPERLLDLRLNTMDLLLGEAVRLDPAFEAARLRLIDEVYKVKGSDAARLIVSAGLKINPESIPLMLKLGAMELYCGRPDKAKEAYEKIYTVDPQNAAAAFNIGVVDYRSDHRTDAEEHFNRSLSYGGNVDNYYYLGLIYRDQGKVEKAIGFFEKRWELRKSDEDPYAVKAKEYAEVLKRQSGS